MRCKRSRRLLGRRDFGINSLALARFIIEVLFGKRKRVFIYPSSQYGDDLGHRVQGHAKAMLIVRGARATGGHALAYQMALRARASIATTSFSTV
jgi:hypothetical protein